MQRLAGFEHHVVGNVDNVIDCANAAAFEPVAQPGWRWRDANFVYDSPRITRAKQRGFNRNGNPFLDIRIFCRCAVRQHLQFSTCQRRDFPSDSGNAQTIAAIRRDSDLEQPIFLTAFRLAQGCHRLHFEPRHRERLGEIRGRELELDKLFKPIQSELHRIGITLKLE